LRVLFILIIAFTNIGNCNEFIKKEENIRLYPYSCSKGKATIGWGTRFYCDGSKVSLKDKPILKERADIMFNCHLIKRVYPAMYKIELSLSSNQKIAVQSFIYRNGMYSVKTKRIQKCKNHKCISDIIKNQKDVPDRVLREWKKFNE